MKLRNLLLASALMAVPAAAMAQPVTGPYIAGGVGYNFTQDWNADSSTGPAVTLPLGGGHLEGSGGIAGVFGGGWGFGNGVRVELELNYKQQHDKVVATGFTGGGFEQSMGVFANVYYDFDIGSSFYPYIGGGVGYEQTTLNGGHANHLGVSYNVGGVDGGLAAQAKVGVAMPLASMPGLSLTAEYRFMAQFGDRTYGGGVVTTTFENQYNHAFLLGVRYAFGAPPPPPAPAPAPVAAPAPAPARTYLVFFDWDKADLTARARQIIAEAAQASTRVAVTRIEVNGYTDRSGTPAYNQTLSVKRGQSVAAELVHDGVPQSAIAVMGYGETHPLVATADGVREPQNRRVEIILH